MTGLPRIFDKVNIKTFPSNVKSVCVVTSEMLKCCYSLDFKHFTEFRSPSSYWTYEKKEGRVRSFVVLNKVKE